MSTQLYKQAHATHVCQYHIVFIPRYRGKVLDSIHTKQELKRMFKFIAKWKGLEIKAWHIGDEHIHLYLIIPPKYSVSYIIQILKSKSSSWIKKKTKKFPKGAFWARGYFVSTVGINELTIKNYINNQQHHQVELQKLPLKFFGRR